MKKEKKVAIIGAGAAGYFAALSVAKHHPEANISVFEKSSKVLAKVKISGGGRCNVTHNCGDPNTLIKAYPRGGRKLKHLFHQFAPNDTVQWFEARGVPLKTEEDGRMFPTSDDSQSIIDCLQNEIQKYRIKCVLATGVKALKPEADQWRIVLEDSEILFDSVIVTTGGSPKRKGFDWLANLDHEIVSPVPSLFTFNMPNHPITALMGVVAENAKVSLSGTNIKTEGPILITHWGMSGPAILKASAFGARILAEKKYQFSIQVAWITTGVHVLQQELDKTVLEHPHKKINNHNPLKIPNRLWRYLLEQLSIPQERRWNEVGQKNLRRLVERLTNDRYEVNGKTTFKEEFVTSGGIALSDVNLKTMESKKHKGLFFAGEVLDVDAITGGYNFQAAWSSGHVAGKLGTGGTL